jgi:hypothetical protein
VFGHQRRVQRAGRDQDRRFYGSGPKDAVVTVATDGFDRYPSGAASG